MEENEADFLEWAKHIHWYCYPLKLGPGPDAWAWFGREFQEFLSFEPTIRDLADEADQRGLDSAALRKLLLPTLLPMEPVHDSFGNAVILVERIFAKRTAPAEELWTLPIQKQDLAKARGISATTLALLIENGDIKCRNVQHKTLEVAKSECNATLWEKFGRAAN